MVQLCAGPLMARQHQLLSALTCSAAQAMGALYAVSVSKDMACQVTPQPSQSSATVTASLSEGIKNTLEAIGWTADSADKKGL